MNNKLQRPIVKSEKANSREHLEQKTGCSKESTMASVWNWSVRVLVQWDKATHAANSFVRLSAPSFQSFEAFAPQLMMVAMSCLLWISISTSDQSINMD